MSVTVETSPAFIQAETYSAEIMRRGTFGFMLQRGSSIGSVAGGLVGAEAGVPDLQVTWSGSGTVCNVAAGEVIVPGSTSGSQSGYYLRVPTAGTVAPAANGTGNPRVDLVYAQVQDAAYSGGTNAGVVTIATGTPTSGATLTNLSGAPAVPMSAIAIAYILLPASNGAITNSNIRNLNQMAYLGPGIFNTVSTGVSYTASSADCVLITGGSPTITLPVPFKNARVMVTNYGTGAPTVSRNGSEVIYGRGINGGTSMPLAAVGATATFWSNGSNWFIVAGELDSGWLYVGDPGQPSFASGWSNWGTPYTNCGFRKIGDVVRLTGLAVGTSGTVFTLPSGFRPTATLPFEVLANNASGRLDIDSSGGVTLLVGTGTDLSFNGIKFTTD